MIDLRFGSHRDSRNDHARNRLLQGFDPLPKVISIKPHFVPRDPHLGQDATPGKPCDLSRRELKKYGGLFGREESFFHTGIKSSI